MSNFLLDRLNRKSSKSVRFQSTMRQTSINLKGSKKKLIDRSKNETQDSHLKPAQQQLHSPLSPAESSFKSDESL